MKKITYNLAGTPKIDTRAFALILAVLALAVVLLNIVTLCNLADQRRQNRAEKNEIRFAAMKMESLQQKTVRRKAEIAAWKKTWERKLAYANSLIRQKSFSFISRLDFLENTCSAGMRVRQLDLVNEPAGRMRLTVSALAQNQLLEFYKKLLPYGLVIASENQMVEYYQASLNIRIQDAQK